MTVRISIAACVNRLVNVDTGEFCWLGFANKGAFVKSARMLYTALAGGMLAWPAGEESLMERYGADFTGAEREDGGIDLRFFVGDEYVEEIMSEFLTPSPTLYEQPLACIIREVAGELATLEIPGLQDTPVLDEAEVSTVCFKLIEPPYRQPVPDDGVGTSANAAEGIPTRRLFYFVDMEVSDGIWQKLEASHICRFLSQAEAAGTNGGRNKVVLPDGATVGDNIVVL